MKCKVFAARTRHGLEEEVNAWLATYPGSLTCLQFQYGAVSCDDAITNRIEHTLILFYVDFSESRV